MRVIYKNAEQAHAVPSHILPASGPFQKYEPQKAEPYPEDHGSFPPGATAQNGMRGVRRFQCRDCGDIVLEPKLADHICKGEV